MYNTKKLKLESSEFLALESMQCSMKEEFCLFGAVPLSYIYYTADYAIH